MQYFLLHFGYAFLVLGLILEGDATLVAAMILARQAGQQYFDLHWVIGIALGVTIGGNELLYELGALGWLEGRLGTGRHYQRVSTWLHESRSGTISLLFSRFMWGFRLMIPVAAGMLHIRRRRFSIANAVGGAIWVAALAYFGVAVQTLFVSLHNDLMRYQLHIAVAVFLLGVLIGIITIPWQITRRGNARRVADASLGLSAPPEVPPAVARPLPPASAPSPQTRPGSRGGRSRESSS